MQLENAMCECGWMEREAGVWQSVNSIVLLNPAGDDDDTAGLDTVLANTRARWVSYYAAYLWVTDIEQFDAMNKVS